MADDWRDDRIAQQTLVITRLDSQFAEYRKQVDERLAQYKAALDEHKQTCAERMARVYRAQEKMYERTAENRDWRLLVTGAIMGLGVIMAFLEDIHRLWVSL